MHRDLNAAAAPRGNGCPFLSPSTVNAGIYCRISEDFKVIVGGLQYMKLVLLLNLHLAVSDDAVLFPGK